MGINVLAEGVRHTTKDLIISDVEYCYGGQQISSYFDHLTECMQEYCTTLIMITTCAVKDVAISGKLIELHNRMGESRNLLESQKDALSETFSEFIRDVEETDQFKY